MFTGHRYRHHHHRRLHFNRRPYSLLPDKSSPSLTAPREITHQTHTGYCHHHRPRRSPLWHPRSRHQNPYPPSLPSPLCQPMEIGDEFVDFKALKAAMADWSITGAHKFTFRHQKSAKARSILVCAHAGCFFRVYTAMDKDRSYIRFQVALYLLRSCSDTTSGRFCRTGRNIAAGSKLPTKFRLGAVGNTSFPWKAVWAQHIEQR